MWMMMAPFKNRCKPDYDRAVGAVPMNWRRDRTLPGWLTPGKF